LIVEDIEALLDLSKFPKPTPEQRSKAKGHMQQLRRAGFSNRDIFILSDEFWEENTIKQYLKGEKAVNTTERDKIMKTIVDLMRSELTFDDVNTALSRKELLDHSKLTVEDEARLIQAINQGVELQQLSNALRELSPNEILQTNRIYKQLISKEWDIPALNLLKEVTDKHGGAIEAFKALLIMGSINELQERLDNLESLRTDKINEVIAKNQDINRQNTEILSIKTYVDMSKILINEYSFDLSSLITLMNFAKKYGPPWGALEAINKYNQLQDLDDVIKKRQIEAAKTRDELTAAKAELDEINQVTKDAYEALGGAEEKLDKVAITQGLHDLLTDPKKTQLTRDEFLNTAYAVIDGLIKYADYNPLTQSQWKGCKQSLEYVRSQTTKLIGKG